MVPPFELSILPFQVRIKCEVGGGAVHFPRIASRATADSAGTLLSPPCAAMEPCEEQGQGTASEEPEEQNFIYNWQISQSWQLLLLRDFQ